MSTHFSVLQRWQAERDLNNRIPKYSILLSIPISRVFTAVKWGRGCRFCGHVSLRKANLQVRISWRGLFIHNRSIQSTLFDLIWTCFCGTSCKISSGIYTLEATFTLYQERIKLDTERTFALTGLKDTGGQLKTAWFGLKLGIDSSLGFFMN